MNDTPGTSPAWNLGEIVSGLRGAREQWRQRQQREHGRGGDREFPSVERIACAIKLLRGALFPLRLGPTELKRAGEDFYVGHTLDQALNALVEEVRLELTTRVNGNGESDAIRQDARRRVEGRRSTPGAGLSKHGRRRMRVRARGSRAEGPPARQRAEVPLRRKRRRPRRPLRRGRQGRANGHDGGRHEQPVERGWLRL